MTITSETANLHQSECRKDNSYLEIYTINIYIASCHNSCFTSKYSIKYLVLKRLSYRNKFSHNLIIALLKFLYLLGASRLPGGAEWYFQGGVQAAKVEATKNVCKNFEGQRLANACFCHQGVDFCSLVTLKLW